MQTYIKTFVFTPFLLFSCIICPRLNSASGICPRSDAHRLADRSPHARNCLLGGRSGYSAPKKHETGRNVSIFRKRFRKSTKPAETCQFWSLRSRQHTITVEHNEIIINNIRKPRAANGEHVIHVRAYQSRGCAPQEIAHRGHQNRQPRPKRRLFEDVVLVILNPVCKNKPL